MALPASGPISVNQVAVEFSRANNMAAFYSAASGIPASGAISLSQFYGKSFAGQVVFTASGWSTWTVPAGVTSICMVCVQAGHGTVNSANGGTNIRLDSQGGSVICSAYDVQFVGDAGFRGGASSAGATEGYDYFYGGGGGAAGYTGNGGAGGFLEIWGDSSRHWMPPGAGAGGGGGGGGASFRNAQYGGRGGGVGLLGVGSNGVGGTNNQSTNDIGFGPGVGSTGGAGSGGSGQTYGGGGTYQYGVAYFGGSLAYKNNVAVTPGQVVRIYITAPVHPSCGPGAARIIWGAGRSYPYNAGNV